MLSGLFFISTSASLILITNIHKLLCVEACSFKAENLPSTFRNHAHSPHFNLIFCSLNNNENTELYTVQPRSLEAPDSHRIPAAEQILDSELSFITCGGVNL